MRIFAILFLFLGLIGSAHAQSDDRAGVTATVDRFLNAINTNDPTALKGTQLPEGMTFRLLYDANGTMTAHPRSNAEWVERTAKATQRFHEQYWSPTVLIHRDMAVFWAPYSFDIDGKRSHCGVDVFELVKVAGEWKIANAMWTVEPDGCPKP